MRLGLNLGYSGSTFTLNLPLILEAERLGFHSVWAAEGSSESKPGGTTTPNCQRN